MSEDSSVGSVAEEAAKLLGALQEWARENGSDYAHAASTAAGAAAASAASINEHIATGGADCKFCPICRLIAAVRATSPEVKHHLASAATSLVQALAAGMATATPRATERDQPGTTVQKINLDDEDSN